MTVSDRLLHQIALSREEYELAVQRLGRAPTEVELGMIGALWSEHCGYKNSKPLLRLFPTQGPRVLTRAGEENAGAVDIGDGLLVAMKIESHNHPSAIEPYQGAATGVGGIVRDIFAMGVRPIALLDSLRFGPIASEPPLFAPTGGDQPTRGRSGAPLPPMGEARPASQGEGPDIARNRYLFTGVVAGIGGYGNCLGLPTVGGETVFDDAYSTNPLVNAMCVGVARHGQLVRARAEGAGNLLMLVGADTGRDGIHGATFASVELDETSEERRPAVQVGNPFLEKLLMEACLELVERGRDWIVGMQDLGAAGLTSAAVECAARAGTGVVIDVTRVPRREAGMTPYEVMLSESQERMLLIVRRGCEDKVRELLERWELHVAVVGEVTDDGLVRVREGAREVACLPVALLTDPPLYRRQGVKPAELAALQRFDLETLPDLGAVPAADALLALLRTPNLAAKRWVWRQYDHQVLTNTVIGPGHDAAVLRIRGTRRAIALSTDGNGRLCYLDPYMGGAIAVAEAARNVVCTGAEPLAVTDCLNFGNPERPEIYYQLEQVIRGMSAACAALGTPVISGNVSLYNETLGNAVYPTPVVGMLGLIEDIDRRCDAPFRRAGDVVALVSGPAAADDAGRIVGRAADLAGSEYLKRAHGLVAGQPAIDLAHEAAVQRCVLAAIRQGLLSSAHDCADGGLAVALAECAVWGEVGLDAAALAVAGRLDAALFGEAQSRIVVSLPPEHLPALERLAAEHGVRLTRLGATGGDRFRLTAHIDLPLAALREALEDGLPQALAGAAHGGVKEND
jgi:phosphoribosylformylglycinamidine synthase II